MYDAATRLRVLHADLSLRRGQAIAPLAREEDAPATGWTAGCRLSLAGTSPAESLGLHGLWRTTTADAVTRGKSEKERGEGMGETREKRRWLHDSCSRPRCLRGDKGSIYVPRDVFALTSIAYLELIRPTQRKYERGAPLVIAILLSRLNARTLRDEISPE